VLEGWSEQVLHAKTADEIFGTRSPAGHGDSYRQPPRVRRQFGRTRRWNRHQIPANAR